MSKPIRVLYSELSGKFYATSSYKEGASGLIEVTGEKFDVTQDIAAAIDVHGITFKKKEPRL